MPNYTENTNERMRDFLQSLPDVGKKHGWITKAAKLLNLGGSQGLRPYLDGTRIPGNTLQARLRNLGADLEWIMFGEKKADNLQSNHLPLMNVPVYAHVNAGEKKWVVAEEVVDYITIPKSSDTTLFGLIVKGDSMYDEINDGDIIILSGKAEVKSGDLCVVEWMDGDRHLRRVAFDKNNIVLTSKNNELFPPIITHKSKIRKFYRVMKHIRNY